MKAFLAFVLGGLLVWAVMSHLKPVHSPVVQAHSQQEPERMATMAEQGACAKQSREKFQQEGWTLDGSTDFTNHYSPKLGKCFIEVSNFVMMHGKFPSESKVVADAFEGTVVARYNWINLQGKQFYEVLPSDCTVDDATCKSSDEFDAMVFKQYGLDAVK